MRKLLGVIVLTACVQVFYGQQDYQMNQFFNDKVSLNPGATGMSDNCLGFFYRHQWAGFSGNPETFLINYHQPVEKLRGGVGITAINDRLGNQRSNNGEGVDGFALTNNYIRLNYSYHFENIGGGTLGAGLSLGYQGVSVGTDWYSVDPAALDDAIPTGQDGRGSFDLNLGVYYQTQKFWAGLSSTHLTAQDFDGNQFDFSAARHLYFMTGYETDLGGSNWDLLPSLLVKSDLVSNSLDLNVRGEWDDFIWGGVGFRTGIDAISPMAGFNWQLAGTKSFSHSIQFGYSYDVTLSDVKNFSSGSHEIFAGYCFKPIELIIRKKHSNPRFL